MTKNYDENTRIPEKTADPDCAGHRGRLRKRFLEGGHKALAEHELIELLLTYSIPRKDVKGIAKALLKKFDSVAGILNAEPASLLSVKGVSENSAALFRAVHASHVKCSEEKLLYGDPLSSPETVINFSRTYLNGFGDENLMAIFVNPKNRIAGYEIISEGTVDSAVVYPRKIIKKALEKNANGIILVHNHPSGDPNPSQDDISLTKAVKNAAAPMDIRLLDHIIVAGGGHYSFFEQNIMP